MLITLKRPILDTIVLDEVVDNILDEIVGMGVMILSKNETITFMLLLSLLLVMKSAYLEILS